MKRWMIDRVFKNKRLTHLHLNETFCGDLKNGRLILNLELGAFQQTTNIFSSGRGAPLGKTLRK
jgi:hypothetical protein